MNAQRIDERTPLHWAAMNGQTEAVQLLLQRGAAIDAKDVGDRSSLYQAASKGHREAASLLIDEGAECTMHDAAGAVSMAT